MVKFWEGRQILTKAPFDHFFVWNMLEMNLIIVTSIRSGPLGSRKMHIREKNDLTFFKQRRLKTKTSHQIKPTVCNLYHWVWSKNILNINRRRLPNIWYIKTQRDLFIMCSIILNSFKCQKLSVSLLRIKKIYSFIFFHMALGRHAKISEQPSSASRNFQKLYETWQKIER